MKKTTLLLSLLFVFSSLISGCNTSSSSETPLQKQVQVDKNYLLALRTANNFLIAWLNRDAAKGSELLTDNAKKSVSPEDLTMFFSGLSNPHHQGFEIIGHENAGENTVTFHVWLYEYYSGETPEPEKRPEPYTIEVSKVDENTWLVNNLPK
ncbi:hypothetical protein [Brevibacillus reuszeri]|uniref:hypothetical protein n=1 Tax=Brevibacillus reuszeri TaxID=54915 RepID=UPI000CCBE388|nr:hypothetical protein [Brevibacillus reuszeri]